MYHTIFHHFITYVIPYKTMFSVSTSSDKMSTSEQRITRTEETRLEKLKGDDLIWWRFSTISKILCDLNTLLPVIWGIGSQIPILCQEFKVANDGEIWKERNMFIAMKSISKEHLSQWGVQRVSKTVNKPHQEGVLQVWRSDKEGPLETRNYRLFQWSKVLPTRVEEVTTRRSHHLWFSDSELLPFGEHPLS